MCIETWKQIENTNGMYEVSDFGRVRSKDRMVKNRWKLIKKSGKILKTPINAYGYPVVSIVIGSKQTTQTVHRLVASAFLETQESKKEVNHKDGYKTNNNLSNLEWCDRASNMRHAASLNLMRTEKQKAANKRKATINLEIANKIREAVKSGMSQDNTAKLFGTHQSTVSKIVRNKAWIE